ncbi:hypothetical protein BREVNS_2297 [Brevinematales bacterium NS]|nr:hypothetical protein [Brevinematales bacterium]QJR23047.1 hypothetical protein BREVNS_2297 [Brevinematales bacterium NS]
MKRMLFFCVCILLVFSFSCDMKKQTRQTPPEKPKTVATKDSGETVSSSPTVQKKSSGSSSWWERMWSPLSSKTSGKKTPSSSWQVAFENFTSRLNPATIVFTMAGGGIVLHFLLKAFKR